MSRLMRFLTALFLPTASVIQKSTICSSIIRVYDNREYRRSMSTNYWY